MAEAPRSLSELYRILIDLQQECLDAGSAEASYHALSAALHCAEAAGDVGGITQVITLAKQRQELIDARRPRHPLSTQEATRRGTTPLFASLGATAQAVKTRLHAEAVRAENVIRRRRDSPADRA